MHCSKSNLIQPGRASYIHSPLLECWVSMSRGNHQDLREQRGVEPLISWLKSGSLLCLPFIYIWMSRFSSKVIVIVKRPNLEDSNGGIIIIHHLIDRLTKMVAEITVWMLHLTMAHLTHLLLQSLQAIQNSINVGGKSISPILHG